MTRRDPIRTAAGATCLTCAVLAAVIAVTWPPAPPPDGLLVPRSGYLAGVRYADQVRDDPATAPGWPRDEAGVNAACRPWIDAEPRGFDRDGFLAGCADAVEVPR